VEIEMAELDLKTVLIILLLALNAAAFCAMGIDKWKAKREKKRIRESNLFLLSFCFGGAGILLGMLVFRHKTKHVLFWILVPVSIVVNILAVIGAVNVLL